MLSSIAGAGALEILVQLRDLSQAGLLHLQRNIATTEAKVNATNFGGFSKASKGLAADAERAAGKSGGGGLMGMLSGFVGLPGPVALAGVAIGGFAALAASTIPVYEKHVQNEKALAIALLGHGESLDILRPKIEEMVKVGEKYAYQNDEVEATVIKLTQAGMSFSDIQANLPHIMDLARAKNLGLAEAAKMYELVLMGNTRAVKDLGIALPLVTNPMQAQTAATNAVTAAQAHLDSTTQHLTDVENALGGKHKMTAADAIRLRDAHKAVDDASQKLKKAQDGLAATQDTAASKAARMKLVNDGLTTALGDQRASVTPLQVAQAKLGNAWEKFAVVVAPALVAALSAVMGALAALVGWIADAVTWFEKVFAASDKFTKQQTGQHQFGTGQRGAGTGGGRVPRAGGGPIGPGGAYIVGESGPEMLDVGAGGFGMVTPLGGNRAVSGGMHSASGGQTVIQHTSIVQIDGREIARQMDRYLHRTLVGAGSGIRRPLGG